MTRALGNSSTVVTYVAAICNGFGEGVSDPMLRIQNYCCQGRQTPPPNGTRKYPSAGRKTHARNLGGALGRCWAQLWMQLTQCIRPALESTPSQASLEDDARIGKLLHRRRICCCNLPWIWWRSFPCRFENTQLLLSGSPNPSTEWHQKASRR